MNKLIIIGAGGHGRVVADNAMKNGYTDICFVDDHVTGECMGYPIIGTIADIEKFDDGMNEFILGIGSNELRKKIVEAHNVKWASLIHPSAEVASNVTIGKGTVVMARAVINACAAIGNHCIINTTAIIEHDNTIEDYVHISPGVMLGGTVRVGMNSHLGIGAIVSNNVSICDHCVIGAGAVVIKDIEESGTYVGVPVRKIN